MGKSTKRSKSPDTPRSESKSKTARRLSLQDGDEGGSNDEHMDTEKMGEDAMKEVDIQSTLGALLKGQSAIKDSIESFKHEISIIKTEMDEQFKGVNYDLSVVQGDVGKHTSEIEMLINKIDDLENRSRRCNLVIFGVPEKAENNPWSCIDFVKTFISNFLKLPNADRVVIQRAHRTPTGPPQSDSSKTRPIHVAFLRYEDREAVRVQAIKTLKTQTFQGKKIFVSEDFSRRIQLARKSLLEAKKSLAAQGKQPFFIYPAILKYRENDIVKTYNG